MLKKQPEPSRSIDVLLEIMAALRNPTTGCPWDVKQTFQSIAPYTLEEAYEVLQAIFSNNREDLRDELGDLLLQVVFHARMAEEEGAFDFGDVVTSITTKMLRRHPHVFGEATAASADDVRGIWNQIKAQEQSEKAQRQNEGVKKPGLESPYSTVTSLLSQVKPGLQAASYAVALQEKASTVGFDWNNPHQVIAKIKEELAEIEEAINEKASHGHLQEEIGDVLFAVSNLARHVKVDPELALHGANAKFLYRFHEIEKGLMARGRTVEQSTLEEMEALWQEAKKISNNLR